MQPPPLPRQSTFPKIAAWFSLAVPLLVFAVNLLLQRRLARVIESHPAWGGLEALLILAGLVFGIVAWISSRRNGGGGIRGTAIAGTCLNAFFILCALIVFQKRIAARHQAFAQSTPGDSLVAARSNYVTHLLRKRTAGLVPDYPPPKLFVRTHYKAEPGDMAAYLSPDPHDGKRHPAIIWVSGGFDNSISDFVWTPQPAENDQSAGAFWKAGIITMYPSLRGGNVNPGVKEGFYGEVDDVRAAADFLANQSYVDPARIYLGGHSTGGTLALLVSETSTNFRAIFAFGPVSDIRGYGAENLPFDLRDSKETELRSPILWLKQVHTPTFVFEGAQPRSNIDALHRLEQTTRNPALHFYDVKGYNHFSILAPVTRLIATKILRDTNASPAITFSAGELQPN
jgi:hypothetical protein